MESRKGLEIELKIEISLKCKAKILINQERLVCIKK